MDETEWTWVAVSVLAVLLFMIVAIAIVFAFAPKEELPTNNTTLKPTFKNENISYFSIWDPDYSKVPYAAVNPGNKSRFLVFECINSTLKFNETSIWCEKISVLDNLKYNVSFTYNTNSSSRPIPNAALNMSLLKYNGSQVVWTYTRDGRPNADGNYNITPCVLLADNTRLCGE